ncbi:uncharacterized protein BP01DRAFT_83646 [Aspergillus saccharolyticus JOP 1030-1]|uniref:Uncharacterized protein n=1 Tax=Aspergillus saccharolyticus JOP 1030-1 TaxID=1450539 RepID=A0A318ZAJ9_9EURO|nr:hypothetical protein BP01DRAFT_83646 [Aspergillus saccharolyticus JOP 1030-1]PYH44471.1 hypothetical protein BP01DRAFT_83646 [Aspergillus saccharolyticus JOP 1030-1]
MIICVFPLSIPFVIPCHVFVSCLFPNGGLARIFEAEFRSHEYGGCARFSYVQDRGTVRWDGSKLLISAFGFGVVSPGLSVPLCFFFVSYRLH